jgi:pantothenate kinase
MATQPSNGDGFRLSDELNKLKMSALERMDSHASSQGALISPNGASPGATQRGTFRSHRTEPFIIGVAGGTASGKTTVCDQIVQRLNGKQFSNSRCLCLPNKFKFFLLSLST